MQEIATKTPNFFNIFHFKHLDINSIEEIYIRIRLANNIGLIYSLERNREVAV